MTRKTPTVHQYRPLATPRSWGEEERRFVRSLTEVLDDVYRRYGRLGLEDTHERFRNTIDGLQQAAHAQGEALGVQQQALGRKVDATACRLNLNALGRDVAARAQKAHIISAVNQSPESERIAPERIRFAGADIGGLVVQDGRLYTQTGVEIDTHSGAVCVGALRIAPDEQGGVVLQMRDGAPLRVTLPATDQAPNLYIDPDTGQLMRTQS